MFEALKDMESFTEDMFNRIIAFQEKEHPAWIETLPFADRIRDLPLHYLIFSNGDRDPQRFGPTVAPFYPLHHEILTLAHYIRQLGDNPLICDVHAGNGFLGSLIGREGFQVIGLRDPNARPNQIADFFDPECYQPRSGTLDDDDLAFDVALSSWMPSERNDTPAILRHQPKLIIYFFTDHLDQGSGHRQVGSADAFVPGRPYELIDEWEVIRPANLFRDIWPDLTGNIEETRKVRVFARSGFHHLSRPQSLHPDPYDWERELEMALLAHRARDYVQTRGFPPLDRH